MRMTVMILDEEISDLNSVGEGDESDNVNSDGAGMIPLLEWQSL